MICAKHCEEDHEHSIRGLFATTLIYLIFEKSSIFQTNEEIRGSGQICALFMVDFLENISNAIPSFRRAHKHYV